MKEASSSKKMPRKTRAPPTALAPSANTKLGANEEILSSLLRLNNFDSNIKDESLDIDLSACVTISAESAGMLGSTNSLSSTDFWRVLDDNAQTAQLDLTNASDDLQTLTCTGLSDDALEDSSIAGSLSDVCYEGNNKNENKRYIINATDKIVAGLFIKEEHHSFSGTFLKPEAPPPTPSPLKRLMIKPMHADQQQRQADRTLIKEKARRDLKSEINAIGQSHQSNTTHVDDSAVDSVPTIARNIIEIKRTSTNHNLVVNSNQPISSSSFNIFALPEGNIPPYSSSSSSSSTSKVAISISPSDVVHGKEAGLKQAGPSIPEPVFKCLDCDGLILQGRREYATHEAVGHRIHYRCSVCDRDFEQEASLKKHIKTHRSMEARKDAWKKCPDCGKCLKLGSMWMHRKIHSDNKKYGCDICGQKFVQKINLTHHSRIHTAEKPYECPECQKRFQERSHLQRHQKYHAQTRSYRCEKCGKMYKTERCLKVHNLVHLEQRPFACNVCEKSFISNSKLKQHSNIHTGERPFKCNYCPRDFTNFPNWLKHTRRRHKVDHKTGEHLENIPSYCSKKSAKSTKAKTTDTNTEVPHVATTKSATSQANISSAPVATVGLTTVTQKSQASKRKKKAPPTQPIPPPPLASLSDDNPSILVPALVATVKTELVRTNAIMTSIPLSMATMLKPNTATKTISSSLSGSDTCKVAKPKRERKQLSPKQLQKASAPSVLLSSIKRELTEPEITMKLHSGTASVSSDTRCAISNFPDLSITSAEELIMEQALEMEECGLYDAPGSIAMDTDNAISSSEATAALHFKIKSEFDPMDLSSTRIKEEEFVTLKDMNQRILCSSLESSPYSSPASIELSTTTSVVPTAQSTDVRSDTTTLTTSTTTNSFHINAFTMNTPNQTVVTGINSLLPHQSIDLQQLIPQTTSQMNSNVLPTTQAIINHFYLHPMTTMGMPLLAQSSTNQKLPSVDTLLFSVAGSSTNTSSHAATINEGRFYHSKSLVSHTPVSSATIVGQPKLS